MLFDRCSSPLCSSLGWDTVTLDVIWLSYLWTCSRCDTTLGCYLNTGGCLASCYRVAGIKYPGLTVLLLQVASKDNLDLTFYVTLFTFDLNCCNIMSEGSLSILRRYNICCCCCLNRRRGVTLCCYRMLTKKSIISPCIQGHQSIQTTESCCNEDLCRQGCVVDIRARQWGVH